MVIISLYQQEIKDGKVYIRSEETIPCPICGAQLKVIGSKKRKAIDSEGHWQTYIIRRLRCKECETIHHELPDFLIPFKRHCRANIECVIAENDIHRDRLANMSLSTVLRIRWWWHAIKNYFSFVKLGIEFELGVNLSTATKPGHLSRVLVNLHKWIHTRSAIDVNPRLEHA